MGKPGSPSDFFVVHTNHSELAGVGYVEGNTLASPTQKATTEGCNVLQPSVVLR
jgi:hypothetical protein